MATFDKLVRVSTLDEAYELNQKRENIVLGGFMWLRQSNRHFQTAIDLSGLSLNGIDETDEVFSIGCMCTLRELECHEGLNREFPGGLMNALGHIVGVQFRNGATVGGSIHGRFGFSDLLTCFLALDSYAELYRGGIIPLKDFISLKERNDILMGMIIKKDQRHLVYHSQRLTKTDFPLIAVGVSRKDADFYISVGARPMKAGLLEKVGSYLDAAATDNDIAAFSQWAANQFVYGTNMRSSADYRQHLATVYIKRAVSVLLRG